MILPPKYFSNLCSLLCPYYCRTLGFIISHLKCDDLLTGFFASSPVVPHVSVLHTTYLLSQMIFENKSVSESCLIIFKELSIIWSFLSFSKYLLFTELQNPLELLKFELLSQSPRALLHLDLLASPASFLPHTLGSSNTELLFHMHCAVSLCTCPCCSLWLESSLIPFSSSCSSTK